MPIFSENFKGQVVSETVWGSAMGGGGSIAKYKIDDPHSLREWWHTILRNHGKYMCYGIFLVLPSDKQAVDYLQEYARELHIISGQNCLILVLGSDFFYTVGLYEDVEKRYADDYWVEANTIHIGQGESVKIAELFGIKLTDFPSLLFFTDIRSSEFALVSLRDLDKEKVGQRLRQIFSTISRAIMDEKDVIASIRVHSTLQNAKSKGNKILGAGLSLAGKSIESAIEALIKATVK